MSAHPEDPRTNPLIEVESAKSFRRCLCCLGPVKWALLLGTRTPYSTTQVAICSSCATTLAPIVAAIAADSEIHPDGCHSTDPTALRDCKRCTLKEAT